MNTMFNLLRASRDPFTQSVKFLVAQEKRFTNLADRKVLTEDGITDYRPKVGEYLDASFIADEAATQRLFEELYAMGFRSKHDSGTSDKLDAARKEHIEDLRKAADLK